MCAQKEMILWNLTFFLNLVPGIQDLYFLNYRISRFTRSIFALIFSRRSSENHFIVFNSYQLPKRWHAYAMIPGKFYFKQLASQRVYLTSNNVI